MKSSKLLKVINTLSIIEQEELTLFLNSPYFHRDHRKEETIALWKYIQAGNDMRDIRYWRKENVYKVLYPKEQFIKGKVEKLMTKLFALLTDFIIQHKKRTSGKLNELLALGAYYNSTDLSTLFQNNLQKLKQLISSSKIQDIPFFYHQFLIEKMETDYMSLHSNRKTDLNLLATHNSLDNYYLLTKLEYACQLLSIHIFISPVDLQNSLDLLDTILRNESRTYLEIPIINLYFHAYQLLRFFDKKEEGYYETYHQLLNKFEDHLAPNQLKALRTLIRNYSISHYLKGSPGYLQKAFLIYKEDLESGKLYYNNYLLPGTLNNLVSLGLRMKKFKWVYQLLQDHRQGIYGSDDAEVSYQFNMAHYFFHKKEYETALKFLNGTYSDQYYKISARRLDLMIFYEMKSVLVDDKINAFKIYIYRLPKRSISEKQKNANRNFVDLLRQICLPKTNKNKARIHKISTKIKSTDQLAEKLWLLEILETLH